MKSKKINTILITMLLLTAISGGLFTYQNFFISKETKESIIYVAKDDISAETVIESNMFTPESVTNNNTTIPYVLDINEYIGQKLKGGLLKDEPLTTVRITNKEDSNNIFKLRIDSKDIDKTPVLNGDNISVYVVLNNPSLNDKESIKKLFNFKRVELVNTTENGTETQIMCVNATEDEVKDYQVAKQIGTIIIVKRNSLDDGSNNTESIFDATSTEVKNSTVVSNKNNNSVISKIFVDGDTIDNLLIKYKTNIAAIKSLNNGKEEFKVGDEIILPSNS